MKRTSQPSASTPRGISVGGPQTVTCAPIFWKARMFERATRECRTSPTIQMLEAVERAEAPAQRVDVEQRLRRVLVLAVAGVDDRRRRPARRRASAAPAHGVRMTIASGLWAFSVRTVSLSDSPFSTLDPLADEVDDVGAQALGRELERRARARGGLVEEVQDGAAAQRRHLLDLAIGDLGEGGGAVADALDARRGRGPRWRAGGLTPAPPRASVIVTSSTPSSSATCTLTRSARAVGRFLPT